MRYRLGLDLGTHSIGWAIVDTTAVGAPKLVDAGVRIFSDGRMPAKGGPIGEPLAVERRNARAARRQRDRRKRRQKLILSELVRCGYLPADAGERRRLLHSAIREEGGIQVPARHLASRVFVKVMKILGVEAPYSAGQEESIPPNDPYLLRAEALGRELNREEVARVVMHLAIHRGFQSNRKTDTADTESSKQYEKIHNLRTAIHEAGCRTLGEYLWIRHKSGKPVRFRPGQSELYPDRDLYKAEFREIRSVQEPYHSNLNWNRIEELLYFQRPLHPQERGRCRYYTDEQRAFVDIPSVTRFRYLQEVRNLRYSNSRGEMLRLNPSDEDAIIAALNRQKTMSFQKIRRIVDTTAKFNLESEKRDKIEGNVIGILLKEILEDSWERLTEEEQDQFVGELYTAETESALFGRLRVFIPELKADEIAKLSAVPIRRRTASVSARFARECASLMERDRLSYDEATERLGFSHYEHGLDGNSEYLPYYGEALPNSTINRHPQVEPVDQLSEEKYWGRITNVSVHIALNQLRKVVNALIDRYGKPSEIVVELGRELKYPKSRVEEIVRDQTKNQKKNDSIKSELKTLGVPHPSREDILKYKLWEELGNDSTTRNCVYCGKPINLTQLYFGDVEIEHILPKSRTLLNGRSNLTVAHRHCNQQKGNRTPYEAFHTNPPGFVYSEILSRANRAFRDRKKRENFGGAALHDIPEVGAFLNRQLTDNTYIARMATQYLSAICPIEKIWGTNGRLTARARRKWGFDSLLTNPRAQLGEVTKNRADHRHHALDAITIAFMSRTLVQQTAALSARSTKGRYRLDLVLPESPVPRDHVLETLKRIIPSIRQNHSLSGKLFEETAMGEHAFPDVEKKPNENGKLWGYRKSIGALSEKDVHEGVVDPVLRKALVAHIENNPDIKLDKALALFAEETGVRRVRIVAKNQTVRPIETASFKAYAHADIFCCVVWKTGTPSGKAKYVPVYWTRKEAISDQSGFTDHRPHPTAKKLHVLFKGDVLRVTRSGESCLAVVKGFSSTNGKIDLQPAHASGDVGTWLSETNPELTTWLLRSPRSGQNYESVNRAYTEFRVERVSLTPDGLPIGRYIQME